MGKVRQIPYLSDILLFSNLAHYHKICSLNIFEAHRLAFDVVELVAEFTKNIGANLRTNKQSDFVYASTRSDSLHDEECMSLNIYRTNKAFGMPELLKGQHLVICDGFSTGRTLWRHMTQVASLTARSVFLSRHVEWLNANVGVAVSAVQTTQVPKLVQLRHLDGRL